jgi:hypothetical protein
VNGPGPFSDVPPGSLFCKKIGFLWIQGIVDGFGDIHPTYHPNDNVTRGQMAKFLDLAFGLTIGPAQ